MSGICNYPLLLMAYSRATRTRRLAATFIAAAVAFLGCWFKDGFVGTSYDSLHSLSAKWQIPFDDSRVVIIYLDLNSYVHEHLDPGQRWPRKLHAELLNHLTKQGAKAVVFDIVFDSAGGDSSADDAFAQAIRKNGRTILAAEHSNKNSHETSTGEVWTRSLKLLLPNRQFLEASASWGIASFWVEDDFLVRRHLPPFGDENTPSLSLAAARFLGVTNKFFADGLWLRYYGPSITIPHVSCSEALDESALPKDFFKDKIVFIGARPVPGFMDARRDEFPSPFHTWSNKEYFMPGVEIHATQFLNLLRGDGLKRPSAFAEDMALVLAAIVLGGVLVWFRPIPATILSVMAAVGILFAALVSFSAGLWWPWMVVVAVQIPAALFGSWLWQFQEWFFTRRKLEASQRIADAKIREQAALLDKAHDAILVQELSGTIVYANPSAEKLYGWRQSDLTHDAVEQLFSGGAPAVEKARKSALLEGEWNGELRLQTRSGRPIIVASRWTLIRNQSGIPEALLIISSDITEAKNLEQQFLQTQRMNTIGTLAGGMAHDLNNALAPVLLGTQLLRRKITDEADQKLLSLIESSTHRGADMVRQVLLFARGRDSEMERLELEPILKDMEKIAKETFPRNIQIETFIPADLWTIRGNLTQIHQVLLNLYVNARDAMPEGGKLSCIADNVELSSEEASSAIGAKSGKFVSIMVSDTGTGIPPEIKARIFEPFFTTKGEGKGTGIGLATVNRIIATHGGFLKVESELGLGSSFEMFLPLPSEATKSENVNSNEPLARGHGELILVAEDEKAFRELMAAELREFGYTVLQAGDGAEAIALFKQNAMAIKLFLSDNSMPAVDGPKAIAEIRKLNPSLPIIFTGDEPSLQGVEKVSFLNKPFTLEDLINTVSRSLK